MTSEQVQVRVQPTQSEEKVDLSSYCFLHRMFLLYDNRFLLALGFQYFQIYFNLAMLQVSLLDLAKNHYGIEPSAVQSTLAIILLPWAFKLLYGMFTDIVPLCGSRKKNYIILAGVMQAIVTLVAGFGRFEQLPPFIVCGGLLMVSFAIMDVVLDGLMVQQSRKDPKSGSEDLQAFSWAIAGGAGIIGYVIGGEMSDAGYAW